MKHRNDYMQSEEEGGPGVANKVSEEKKLLPKEPHPALRALARLLARQAAQDFVRQEANDNRGPESDNKDD